MSNEQFEPPAPEAVVHAPLAPPDLPPPSSLDRLVKRLYTALQRAHDEIKVHVQERMQLQHEVEDLRKQLQEMEALKKTMPPPPCDKKHLEQPCVARGAHVQHMSATGLTWLWSW